MSVRIVVATLVVALAVACKGPTGPKGDTGPQGPQGPAGPAGISTIAFAGVLDSNGQAVVQLPAAAGTLASPPVVTCYISGSAAGPYLLVATDTNGLAASGCGLGQGSGGLAVAFAGEPAGWYYMVSIAYSTSG